MNKHIKLDSQKSRGVALNRRSFIVGASSAGLALGFASMPGDAFAAAGSFDPSVWYSIAPDGIGIGTAGPSDKNPNCSVPCVELSGLTSK